MNASHAAMRHTTHMSLMQCGVLQCVAVCCSVLQCVAVCCSVLRHAAMRQTTALYDAVV